MAITINARGTSVSSFQIGKGGQAITLNANGYLTIDDGVDTEQPLGYNTIPIYEIDASDIFDLAHAGMMWHKDSGAAVTFTCDNDSTIPQGSTWIVHNDDAEDITIAQGTGVTIAFLASGAAPATGNVTVSQGGLVTVYKYTDTEYWVWGDDGPFNILTAGATTDSTLRWDGSAWAENTTVTATSTGILTAASTAGNHTFSVDSATTSAAIPVMRLSASSTGTPLAGIGPSIEFEAETAAANLEIGGLIALEATDVTATTEDFDFVFNLMSAGAAATEVARITSTGSLFLPEKADADVDTAGYGQIWVNTATPNELYFTDDAGTDFLLNSSNVLPSGTTTDASLRWSGSAWVEEDRIRISDAGVFTIYDSTLTDSAAFSHNGTNFNTAFTTTTDWGISGLSNINLSDGAGLRFYDGTNTDIARFSHDGTDFNTDFTTTAAWNIDGLSQLKLQSGGDLEIYQPNNAKFMRLAVGNHVINYSYLHMSQDTPDGNNFVLRSAGAGTVLNTQNTGTLDFSILNVAQARVTTGGDFHVLDGNTFRIEDSTSTDFADFSHDGTDFNIDFTNTTDWNVTGANVNLDNRTRFYFEDRTMPTVVDDTVDIGQLIVSSGGFVIKLEIIVNSSGFSVAKSYTIPVNYAETANVWEELVPTNDGGTYSSNNFAVDIRVNNGTTDLRIRRTLGSTAGTAYCTLEVITSNVSYSYTSSTTTASVTAPTAYYSATGVTTADDITSIVHPLRIENFAGTDYVQFAHNGTDLTATPTNTSGINWFGGLDQRFFAGGDTYWYSPDDSRQMRMYMTDAGTFNIIPTGSGAVNIDISSLTGDVQIRDGAGLKIYDSTDTDSADFSHDGTDFNTSFTTTADWNISGLSTKVNILDADLTVEQTGGGLTTLTVGGPTVRTNNSSDARIHMFGENSSIKYGAEITVPSSYIQFGGTTTGGATAITGIRSQVDLDLYAGSTFRVRDSSGVDHIAISHDGTDANIVGTTTTDINITSGITAVNLPEITLTTALDETYGGTGQTTYTTGDILYASAANTLSKLAAGTNTHVLTLAGGVPTWAAAPGASTPTAITVADSTDATSFPAFFESATGDLGPKTDASNYTYNATTGALTAVTFVGDLTGNADTATTATTATNVTVAASASATGSILFTESATGNLPPKSDAGLTYNATTNALTTTTFVGDLTGNADTATSAAQWTTTRTINLTGDVTSDSVNIDGSGNITITNTVVGNDSHTHDANNLTGTVLNSGVVTSSLTTVGTIGTGVWQGTTIAVDQGGTGQTSYVNGELLIGNTTGNTLTKATLTAGNGIDITNGTGSITITGEAASDTNAGIVELATIAETNTGTSTTLAVTPDGLDGWTGSTQITTLGTITVDSATTNADIPVLTLRATSTGTPAIGIGPSIEFESETSAGAPGNVEIGGVLALEATDVTSTSEDFDFVLSTMAAGAAAAERMRVTSTGNVTATSFNGVALTTGGSATNFLNETGAYSAPPAGTVTSVSVVSANGFAGSVATSTTTPAITISTSINSPILAGNGTAISAATTTGTGSTAVLSAAPTLTGATNFGTLVSASNSVATVTDILLTDNGNIGATQSMNFITDTDNTQTGTAFTWLTDAPGTTSATTVMTLNENGNLVGTGTLTGFTSYAGILEAQLLGSATTHTLTNKTFDANGTGNSLSNVDVADLANGTDGELITWSAAGTPTTVATGTATHVLTSNGPGTAPTFQAAPGGGTVSGTGTDNFIAVWNGTGDIDAGGSFLITNAVDKSATEQIDGAWTFTSAPYVTAAAPQYFLKETGVTANNTTWSITADGEAFTLRAWDDAISSQTPFFTVNRTANTIDSINIGATTVELGVQTASTTVKVGGDQTGDTNYIEIGKGFDAASGIKWRRGASTVDSRVYVDATENMIFSIDETNTLSAPEFRWQNDGITVMKLGADTTNPLTLYDAAGTDSVAFSHDGTDFNITSTNTTAINIDTRTEITDSGAAGTAALVVSNVGAANTIAEFRGDSDALVISTIGAGDYKIANNQQDNAIGLYDGTGGVRLRYNGTEGIIYDNTGLNITVPIVAGTIDADFDNVTATDFNGVALTTGGAATNFLNETGAYSVPAVSAITVADESADTTCFPLFVTAATGNLQPKTGTNITFNSLTGHFTATSKSFLIDHPTKEGKKLQYGSLEGPENGVYVRGRLTDNDTIELPDYWTALIDPDSITVNLTPIGAHQNLYVAEIGDNKVVVGGGTDCFYTVYAERVDVDKLEIEID